MNFNIKQTLFVLLMVGLMSCNSTKKENNLIDVKTYPDIKIIGEMKNVMWKGKLGSSIKLDTISEKSGLYGLGPLSYLRGELLINNGISYVSKVTSDSTMTVEKTLDASAPFFVYGNVIEWNEVDLPSKVRDIKNLEKFIDSKTTEYKRPFTFKLAGKVSTAIIHIQNLPVGTKVSSPQEAHQGQTNYELGNKNVEIIGFFSTDHKGVFTHHDSYLHMHLISDDESQMGHLDELKIDEMKLYLPKK